MGLEIHALNLLRHITLKRDLGSVATIGRQELALPATTRNKLGLNPTDRYCETLLRSFDAKTVHSFDVSDYEEATHVVDFNLLLSPEQQYDTVLDFGSLEHVFNQAIAFENIRRLVAINGIACHLLPVNNLNGHGLWQYSSDLLYEIYSNQNGFTDTEVYYASALDHRWWYLASRPQPGIRAEIVSMEPIILLSWSRKVADSGEPLKVYQKFYEGVWQRPEDLPPDRSSPARRPFAALLKRRLAKALPVYLTIRNGALLIGLALGTSRYALSSRNRKFNRIRVRDLLRT